jgi:glycosyltransferase involved in cell wall biosynthesis
VSIRRLALAFGSACTGALLVAGSRHPLPSQLMTADALAAVFFVAGFSLVCALSIDLHVSPWELSLASVGLSLATTTCIATLLAATRVGLTRASLALSLGCFILVLSACPVVREARVARARRYAKAGAPEAVGRRHVGGPARGNHEQCRSSTVLPLFDDQYTSSMGRRRILIVGAGTRLLSAMSYYTIRLTNAFAQRFVVAFMPMRQLVPTFLYPGRSRVGKVGTRLQYDSRVELLRGVDWFWGWNLLRNLLELWRRRPDVVVFQWWTGTVLHTYLVIALLARAVGASIVVEFHEVLDTAEERIPFARAWVAILGRPFFGMASAFVIHSSADRAEVERRYRLSGRPCVVIPHGPLDHHARGSTELAQSTLRDAPPEAINILFFGIIRPYKGLEDLVRAFDMLEDEEVTDYWLTIVGETWEGWDLPTALVALSRHRDRITLINRFVTDEEVISHFSAADAVALPYHRSSASSPAHVTMSKGLPLIITAVGGLPAAVENYEGAILIPPRDPTALRDALRRLPALRGRRYRDPHSWERTVALYGQLFDELDHRVEGQTTHVPRSAVASGVGQ